MVQQICLPGHLYAYLSSNLPIIDIMLILSR